MEQQHTNERSAERRRMIDEQIRRRDIRDERILDAMLRLPREEFIPENIRHAAYEDRALPIGHGQTISQPFIVAYMTQQLAVEPDVEVLEVGTGTGYQTAVLALLARHVYTVERIEALQVAAAEKLADLELTNITMSIGDGSLGLLEHAPYDRILVTAAAPRVPTALTDQLAENGVLVIPVGKERGQTIVRVVRQGRRVIETPTLACRFVKLVGEEGWSSPGSG